MVLAPVMSRAFGWLRRSESASCSLVAAPGEVAQRGFDVVARDGCLGQQDELCVVGYLSEQIENILLLPLGIAVELVVTVDVGLDDADADRSLVGLLPAGADGQRHPHRQDQGRSHGAPFAQVAALLPGFEEEDVDRQHPE